jgi:hypothetical protein
VKYSLGICGHAFHTANVSDKFLLSLENVHEKCIKSDEAKFGFLQHKIAVNFFNSHKIIHIEAIKRY